MSSLWTPEGEHRVPRTEQAAAEPAPRASRAPDGADQGGGRQEEAEQEAIAARLDELRGQLLSTPVEVVVANHAYGLFELAAIHLSQQPAAIEQARLAIDAFGALVEGMAGRLGEAEASLIDALAQIRLAFVQIQAAGSVTDGPPDTEAPETGSAG